jgi:hypothetical protein
LHFIAIYVADSIATYTTKRRKCSVCQSFEIAEGIVNKLHRSRDINFILEYNKETYYILRVKEQRNILHEISKRKANWIGHILRRKCLLRQVIEEKITGGIEVRGKRGKRRRKLLDDLKERRGYLHLKEEALVRTM